MSPVNVFYDTEFLEDGTTIELISIGIVCEDGREYYAINSDADWTRIEKDDWLMTNVIPHLPMRRGEAPYKFENRTWIWGLDRSSVLIKPKWLIANEVREFLTAGMEGHSLRLWADYGAYDHVALAQLWGRMINLPKGIPMWTHDIQQLLEQIPGDWTPPEQSGNAHNALDDARHNYLVWNAAMTALRGDE